MPNYSLQINSRFRPFSFQEMIAPWQLYGQAYKELADSYTSLGVQAGDVASMLNKELDEEAYNQYENYMQGIKDSANILASEGLTPTLRNNAYSLTNRYAQEIRPIQRAAERRQLLAEEQRKLGPGYAFEYDASTTGLDKFMDNPTFTPKQINLADVRQRSAAEFGTLSKQLRSFKENPDMYRKGFDSTVLAEYGYSPEDAARIAESIRRGEVSPEDAAASAIYNSIYGSTGVDSWANNLNEGQQAVRNAIAEGVVGAIGQMTPQIVTDKVAQENYRYQHELDLLQRKAAQDKKDKDDEKKQAAIEAGKAMLNPLPLRNQREISDNNKQLEKWVKKGYITINKDTDRYEITDKGRANMYAESPYVYEGQTGQSYGSSHQFRNGHYKRAVTDFGNFLHNVYGEDLASFNPVTGKNTLKQFDNSKLNDFVSYNKADSYDTQHTTEFDIQLDDAYGKDVLTQANTALRGDKFDVVEWTGNGWKRTDSKSLSDFGKGAKVTNERIKYNPVTNKNESTLIIQNDDGEVFRVAMPPGINTTQEYNRATAFYNADIYRRIVENGYQPKVTTDSNGKLVLDLSNGLQFTDEQLSPADLLFFMNAQDNAYINLNNYGMGIVHPSKTKTFEYGK